MNNAKKLTNKEYEEKMLKELGLNASDLTSTKASVEKSRKAKAKELAHKQAITTLESDNVKEFGKMKYVLAIGLKNKKPQQLNGKYFVIDNVTNDNGDKGHLILEYKSYFENTFVKQYQELGE